MTGSKFGPFPDAGTIMLLYVSMSSSSKEIPSLTAGGGERSTATSGGYRSNFSPLLFRILKNVCWAASLSDHIVLHNAVSPPSSSDI
jgi:hypothetical protein